MSDGLVEALKAAGVPSEDAIDAWWDRHDEGIGDLDNCRALIAADRDAVLRVLLEARLREKADRDGEVRIDGRVLDGTGWDTGSVFVDVADLLDLLAPEGTNGN